MPQKDSINKQEPKQPLRRSPRFLQIVVSDPVNPITPNPEQRLRPRVTTSYTPLTVTQKKEGCSPIRRRSKRSKKVDEPCKPIESVDGLKSRVTRSGKLSICVEECNVEKVLRSSKLRNGGSERRVTCSSGCRDVVKTADKDGCDENVSKQVKGKSVKNKGKGSQRGCNGDSEKFDDNKKEGVLSLTENKGLNEEVSEKYVDRVTNGAASTTDIVVEPTDERDVNKMQKRIGVKRKRNQFEGIVGNGISKSWTSDQEFALERAYLEAKPTPQFWKKVSRLVPGKSAQECFDKIHGSHMTPPQPHLRSKPRISKSQNPFSASKFLNSSSPAAKKPKSRKQKSHVVQRTVRHMLQNQYKVEQDSNADLFSVLEPTFTPSLNCNLMLSTPGRNPNEVLKRCHERSSTAHKKSVSRFSSSYGTPTLVSPPVLKQVKNKALHEKYIDQLNCREANRKAACARAEKRHKSEVIIEEGSVQRQNAIKAAKNALVFGARDAINDFQHQQATVLNYLFDDDDDEEDGQVMF